MKIEFKSVSEINAASASELPAFSGMSLTHARQSVSEALSHVGKLQILEEYTKHDMSHVDSMMRIYDWLIPSDTRAVMTSADWLLLTLSTYLHDFGMLVTRTEYEDRASTEFPTFKSAVLEDEDPETQDYRAQLTRMEPDNLERFLYQEFVRKHHASRVREWLLEEPSKRFGCDPAVARLIRGLFDGVDETFRRDVGLVCESHHENDLDDTEKYPLDRPYGDSIEEAANVQYIAICLRTADLLHVTRDRVPSVAAIVVSPRNPTSQAEWAKQGAVRSVRAKAVAVPEGQTEAPESNTVEVHAVFKRPEGFFGLTSYLQYASEQLVQSHNWAGASERLFGRGYRFPWIAIDQNRIEAEGFETKTFQFSLDQGKILDLLTGHTLYNDTGVVVRELMQNSLDAVRLWGHRHPNDSFLPLIRVKWDSRGRVLEVIDNGTGMTQSVIERNFLRVGASMYQDAEFKRDTPDFTSISRFGIGVLSAFMVADDVEVTTIHPDEPMARHMNLRDVHGRYLVRHIDKGDGAVSGLLGAHGTAVRLTLRPSAKLSNVQALLEHWIVVPGCRVVLETHEGEAEIGSPSVGVALERILLDAKVVQPHENGLADRLGSAVRIIESSSAEADLAFAVVFSEYLREWNFLRVERGRLRDNQSLTLGTCVGGVRVTEVTPGFRASTIAALANAHGRGAPRTNVARSALERTDEFFALMEWFYLAYARHVANEMAAIEEDRSGSITYASREGSYIAETFASVPARAESSDGLGEALRDLPAFVVEEDGERRRLSMVELGSRDAYVTIESLAIADLEKLLASVRGATRASLGTVMDAIGVRDELATPSSPLLCGFHNNLYTSRLFRKEWEIVRLVSDSNMRTLQVGWGKIGDSPSWLDGFSAQGLPRELLSGLERESSNRKSESDVLIARPGAVSILDVEHSLVRCHGMLLLLETHALQQIRKIGEEALDGHRAYIVAWLATRLLESGFGSRRGFEVFRAEQHDRLYSDILERLEFAGALEIVDRESVESALAVADMRVHDVNRWSRREELGWNAPPF